MSNKAKSVKTCDLPVDIAAKLFVALNPGKVTYVSLQLKLITNTEPRDLLYPEGWYYAKGTFRNKHQSTAGAYNEVSMYDKNGHPWGDRATYCTLYD